MPTNKISIALLILIVSVAVRAQSHYPGQHKGKFKIENKAVFECFAFDLHDVRLLESRFKENVLRNSKWVLALPVNSLLHSFRTNAGVFSGHEGGYTATPKLGGWESLDCDLRGHTTGHLLSSLALLYASTGDEVFKQKADSLVKGLAEIQKALGGTGYLSAFPEGLIDRNIAGKSVWAPWYTLHKLFAGLIDQYLYCDDMLALDVVKGMADWAVGKLSGIDEATRRRMIRNEFGGMNESFYTLYAITANPNYKLMAEFFYHNEMIDPLLTGKEELAGKHANTFIPKLLGEAQNYALHANNDSKLAVETFWYHVAHHHSFCTGSNSSKEKFFDATKMSHFLTGYTGETCNTYNMLKLSRHLFCWTASAGVAEFYERALYNHILGQQDPATAMVAYFLPLAPGVHKVYSTPRNSFWCCVGTGFESHAKYAEAIYYYNQQGVFVNLFIPSELRWKARDLVLRQETQFPENGKVMLKVQDIGPNNHFSVYLRYPSWAGSINVTVNGKAVHVSQKSESYIILTKRWNKGDVIAVDLGMELRLCTTPDNQKIASLAYGPVVLAGELGTDGMSGHAPYSNPQLHNDYYTYDYNIPAALKTELKINPLQLTESIVKTEESLVFRSTEGYTLRPLFDIHRQRYIVYWNLINQ